MKERLVKIVDLTLDKTIYPRLKTGWLTAYQYAQAMRSGSVFPPILVGLLERKRYVVDGWHRVQARKMLKEEYISAVVKKFDDKQDMFVEAVNRNTVHGRPLSVQEKARIINKLEEMEFTVEKISEIVKVPVDKIERFKSRVIIGPNGKAHFLKSAVAKATDDVKDALTVDQDKLSVRSVQGLLLQLVDLLESEVYPINDEEVKELSVRVYSLLGERLQIEQTA